MKKSTDTITAQDASEITLDDLRNQVQQLACSDARFNNRPATVTGDNKQYVCSQPWVCDILTDGESFSAVISACDGKTYEVSLTVEDGKVTELGSDATAVTRKTMYVNAKEFRFNGEVVKAGGPGSGPRGGLYHQAKSSANESDTNAEAASEKADKSGKPEDHLAAAAAFRESSAAHSAARTAARSGGQSEKIVGDHVERSQHSTEMAVLHDRLSQKPSVKASGSPIGATKGHASRKSDAANEASQAAHEASATAHDSGDDADHASAAEAHKKASDAHSTAMVAAAKANDKDAANEHAKAMAAHDACATAHDDGDEDDIVKSSAELCSLMDIENKIAAKVAEQVTKDIIHCRANAAKISDAKQWKIGEAVSFMYMPGGISTITAGFRDKAINITVDVDEEAAKTVQASYENLRANLPKQQPFGCIEHREEEASVRASGDSVFSWGEYDGDDGILITAEPTKLGADNVNGKVHRSWSPSFATDADYSKAKEKGGVYVFPEGVRGSASNPARITGIDFCFGTLTNKPAFRNMPPVKAKLENGITAGGPGSGPQKGGSVKGESEADFKKRMNDKFGNGNVHFMYDTHPSGGIMITSHVDGEMMKGPEHRYLVPSTKARLETIFARLEQPSQVDIVFKNLRAQSLHVEPVKAVTADDVFNRLAGKEILKAGGPGSGPQGVSGVDHKKGYKEQTDLATSHETAAMTAKTPEEKEEHLHQAFLARQAAFAHLSHVGEKVKGSDKSISSSTILARLEQTGSPQPVNK